MNLPSLPAEARPRISGTGLRVSRAHPRHARRRDKGALLLRSEPRGGRRQRASDPRGTGKARLDGGRGFVRARDGGLLEAAGRRSGEDSYRSVRSTRRFRCRERRQHRQQRALGAMALPSGEAHRRLPPRPRYRRRPRQSHEARLRERRGISGANSPPRVGLWRSRGSSSRRPRAERPFPGRRDRKRRQELRRGQAGAGLRAVARRRQPRCRATGSTAAATPKRATWPRAAI